MITYIFITICVLYSTPFFLGMLYSSISGNQLTAEKYKSSEAKSKYILTFEEGVAFRNFYPRGWYNETVVVVSYWVFCVLLGFIS